MTEVDLCKVDHAAVKLDESKWTALAYVGEQLYPAEGGGEELLQFRNCVCHTTLCRTVKP